MLLAAVNEVFACVSLQTCAVILHSSGLLNSTYQAGHGNAADNVTWPNNDAACMLALGPFSQCMSHVRTRVMQVPWGPTLSCGTHGKFRRRTL